MKSGNCYQLAYRALLNEVGENLDDGEVLLVQGFCKCDPVNYTGHAWLETNNKVIDCGSMTDEINIYDKHRYYNGAMQVKHATKYTREEAYAKFIELEHYSYWVDPPADLPLNAVWEKARARKRATTVKKKPTKTKKKAPVKKNVKKPGISKAQRAKDQIAKTPDAGNIEIAKLCGNGVTPADVGNARTSLKNKSKGTKKRGKPTTKTATGDLDAAISFVEAAGGLDAAKALIAQIERIKSL
jgi:hypothetical protein